MAGSAMDLLFCYIIVAIKSQKGVTWAFVSLHAHPLTWLSHMLDIQLLQSYPPGHVSCHREAQVRRGNLSDSQWLTRLLRGVYALLRFARNDK